MTFALPVLMIVGLGYGFLVENLSKFKKGKIILATILLLWISGTAFYLQKYFVHFPIESARDYGYGYKQAIQGMVKRQNDFKEIRLSSLNDPPMLYYFFWANVAPKEVQAYGTKYDDDVIKNLPLDRVKPISWGAKICTIEEIAKLNPNTIYMVAYNNLPMDFRTNINAVPKGIKLLEVIKYPDNEVAYYLITRDTKNGFPVAPDKLTSCKN